MFHIVDVDNTLVFTNQLNTAGYVYALAQVGLELSTTIPDRITRDVVRSWYPQLTDQELGFITSHKQAYVRTHLEQTTLNLAMAHLLITQGSEYCALWTAADPERVRLLLNFHNVTDYKASGLAISPSEMWFTPFKIFAHYFNVGHRIYVFMMMTPP